MQLPITVLNLNSNVGVTLHRFTDIAKFLYSATHLWAGSKFDISRKIRSPAP